ncbi:HNH endonuclease [Nocardioides sp. WL0053]|uniref:HNH endonuclease n=1 Tax=Nocardioides jiangsuensis TaxID=2866161 RepID=A0ABS7RHZ2_9ACTN|nr:HNH endonuclease signature motif containing protein [Nocardioides jiangsuensis]MBY9074655.1 HNH endonuclease [Nocardioides jiangsuensis]
MFDTLGGLDPAAVVDRAVARRRAADAAEAELLGLAAHWADLHPVPAGDGSPDRVRVPGMERSMRLAGPGTPEVAEFAAAELASALGLSTAAGQLLVGDALELRHRLPRLWAAVATGTLPAWRARLLAQRTRCLPVEAAGWVDAQVVGFAHKIGTARVVALVEAALLRFDPEQAERRALAAAERRGVWVGDEMTDGTRSIRIEADALDAAAFGATIGRIADVLGALGDDDLADVRRAKAVGVIADPQSTLDLLSGPGPQADQEENPGALDTARTASRRRGGRAARVVLYVHLHADALRFHGAPATEAGRGGAVGRVEGLGAVTVQQIRDWVGRTDVTITPVLDLGDRASVDAYEVPDRMRETVLLRSPCCPFPWCNNLTRRKDLDHVRPYLPPSAGGPPGQTTPGNLAPLCRRHHRLKTHGGWSYTQPEPGTYLWRSPHGRRYRVDHTGTAPLDHTA